MGSKWDRDRYIAAYRFAARAHRGQLYAGTDLPYLMHLSFVSMEILAALAVESGYDGDLAVQCALLHDTIEDTATTYMDLASTFSPQVGDGVQALTKDFSLPKPHQLPDSLDRIHLQPREIWMVKLADRITNLQPPPSHWSPEKIDRYRDEAIVIYDTLKSASPFLSLRLLEKIKNYSHYCR